MYVNVDGARLYFDVDGTGLTPAGPELHEKPTLLMLHGGPGIDHSIFRPAFSALADVAQVVYLDHYGQGRSERGEPGGWNIDRWASDVRGFCDALGIVRPVVMGHSFGGFVAMAYASRYPDHPGKLILANTVARQDMARMLGRFRDLGGATAHAAAEEFWSAPGVETMATYVEQAMPLYSLGGTDIESMARVTFNNELLFDFASGEFRTFDLQADLTKVRSPTLVIGGEQDPVTPIKGQEDIVSGLGCESIRFERLEDCSHMCWLDQPERVMSVISEFISS